MDCQLCVTWMAPSVLVFNHVSRHVPTLIGHVSVFRWCLLSSGRGVRVATGTAALEHVTVVVLQVHQFLHSLIRS